MGTHNKTTKLVTNVGVADANCRNWKRTGKFTDGFARQVGQVWSVHQRARYWRSAAAAAATAAAAVAPAVAEAAAWESSNDLSKSSACRSAERLLPVCACVCICVSVSVCVCVVVCVWKVFFTQIVCSSRSANVNRPKWKKPAKTTLRSVHALCVSVNSMKAAETYIIVDLFHT